MHVPTATRVIVVPLTLHTDGVSEASVTGSPELAVGATVTEPVDNTWLAIDANVIV